VSTISLQAAVHREHMLWALILKKKKCHINTVISPDDGHIVTLNMYRKEINILRKIVHQVGFIYKIFNICHLVIGILNCLELDVGGLIQLEE
jgi:hypothetical protein